MDNQSGWRKSSFSAQGNCVEILEESGKVRVRNTRDRSGPALEFTRAEWNAFLRGVLAGEFAPEDAVL